MSQQNAIRNPDGIWINSQVFREEATKFLKYNYYTNDPWGSPAWYEYWQEQRRRCMYGYSVGGVKITGEHYFYLNFTPIQKAENVRGNVADKVEGFPDFWDGDYNYFWVREIAKKGLYTSLLTVDELLLYDKNDSESTKRLFDTLKLEVKIPHLTISKIEGSELIKNNLDGGFNLIVGKSRRKGYSLKNQAIATNNYLTIPKSYTAFGAYEKKYLHPGAIFSYTIDTINFVNNNTAWAMPSDVLKKVDHIKASYIEYKNGIKIESGFKSEVQAVTFNDNPDSLRGKNAKDIFFEEAGAFGTPGLLKSSYAASQDCVMAGAIKTGVITIFGTSGDMEGGTYDFADMFSRPEAFGLLPFLNVWDEKSEDTKVGFFHPINWNMEGYYDDQGNSDSEAAKQLEIMERKQLVVNGASSSELQKRMQEKPLSPGESFGTVSSNVFPVVELKRQLQKVKAYNLQSTKGTPVNLVYEGDRVIAIPILDNSATPITSYYHIPTNKTGCLMIYEEVVNNPPRGLYKIGYDPVNQAKGTSLAGLIVYKSSHLHSTYHSIIVAEYIGRYENPDDMDRLAMMLADYYNTTIMHENMTPGVISYFTRIKRLNLLAGQPDRVISKSIKKSKTARVYGCHMNEQLKDSGERYVSRWLIDALDYDENGDKVTAIDRMYSVRLLEELISYNRKGNFDLISALFMCMFQVQEEVLGKVHGDDDKDDNIEDLKEIMSKMYTRG